MANNYENFVFDQNALFTSGSLGFHEGSGDLSITPCPTVPQNTESQYSFFMNNSPQNHSFHVNFGDLSITSFHEGQNEPSLRGFHGIPTGFEDLRITYPSTHQNNVGGNGIHVSNAMFDSITFTCPPRQNSAPFMPVSLGIWSGTNHIESSYDRLNWSPSGRLCKKQIRFRFTPWTNVEKKVMDQELLKYTFLPVLKICKKIAALLPKKSIRDVAMRIQWLIEHEKLDCILDWGESSVGGDLSEFNFYIPDNPNDPDLLAIRNRFSPRDVKLGRV
ncbi:hypothetical protein POM88_023655 [Heracleum sosnowskyi]|uniref:Uncharacterized protein n=1 Tax=Heracleum sosnowskyi TaxID=360622 RepID=A0AAD8MQP2_9APIA|nr:hypothetical protein POM88_023655 [Heracleum sosnowskyi]